ncbi:MAG: helix-turn-helix transcriptional regulator [Halioglobus sp.]|nr:helix-turn-helix transcriptional regulator [Halioglobus sp.]
MQFDSELARLLADLYEGPLEESPWQSFLASARELLDADLVTLLLRPPSLEDQVVMLADGGSLSAIRSYNEGQFVLDPFVDLPSGEVFSLQDYLAGDNLTHSEFYRVVMEPQGWYDFLGLDIREEGELDVRFRAGRHEGRPPFGDAERACLHGLCPHLARAVRLHTRINRIEQERAVYAGAMEQLQVVTIILDEQGGVLSTNAAAAQLLAEGSALRVHDGQLRLAQAAADSELRELLQRVRRDRHGDGPGTVAAMQVPADNRHGGLGLVVRAVPPSPGAEGRGIPSAALFISDPAQATDPGLQTVSRLFGLTTAEAKLALALANGQSLDEASAALSISRNTARSHLRSVFAKTGVSRQAGLVRLILRSVAPLAGGARQ